jgi:hypothetical protein
VAGTPSTIGVVLSIDSSVMKPAVRDRRLASNPCESTRLPVDRLNMLKREVLVDRQLVTTAGGSRRLGPRRPRPASGPSSSAGRCRRPHAHLAAYPVGTNGLVFTIDGDAISRQSAQVRGGDANGLACRPGSVPSCDGDDHPSTTTVAGRLQRSTRALGRAALERARVRCPKAPDFLTLLQVGFAEPSRSPGALVGSYSTVSPLPLATEVARGGLFSVALSRESPRVGVTHHLALWSPDLPRPRSEERGRDRPASPFAAPA